MSNYPTAAVWSEQMNTHWLAITPVDHEVMIIDLPKGNCCDMTGTTRLAQTILPNVNRVFIREGGEPDNCYVKDPDGNWCSRYPAANNPDMAKKIRMANCSAPGALHITTAVSEAETTLPTDDTL